MGRALIVPRDLGGPSGGLSYNAHMLAAWRASGLDVSEELVPGTWPSPGVEDRRALQEALTRSPRVLVDGIIASAAPEEIAHAVALGTEVAVLVHLPLPAEPGLSPPARGALSAGERAALTAASRVVCTSSWARADLRARYGLSDVAVAPPGADRGPLAAGSSPPQLLFLGAVTALKNPLLLLEALGHLEHLPWALVVAGPEHQDPDYARRVRAAAARFAPGRVTCCGPVTGSALERLWDRTDLLVLPSSVETYGMVVTEAIAHGIPAVVGAGTGAEDTLRAGSRDPTDPTQAPGAALDPGSPERWAEQLGRWLDDEDLRRRWRACARADRIRLRGWPEAAEKLRTAIQW